MVFQNNINHLIVFTSFINSISMKYWLLIFFILFLSFKVEAQQSNTSQKKFQVSGQILERDGRNLKELDYATITIPDYGISTTSGKDGHFVLENISSGKVYLRVEYLGLLSVDTLINVDRDISVTITMQPEGFRLETVRVVAESGSAGQSSSSKISRTAIDHLQATSLSDIMGLLPGGITTNQNLNNAKQLNIRAAATTNQTDAGVTTSDAANMNAFGAAIISDGAPISNNANLQAMNPAVIGATSALTGGTPPSGGVDLRSIATDNVESVEVISGIPSVRYGDISSGAVIVKSKAGHMPMRINLKVNPNTYQVSVATGINLGGKKGALNISADYANNTNSIIQSYLTYKRTNAKLLYSNRISDKWTTNTSVSFLYDQDRRKRNPDDETVKRESKGNNVGGIINTNGTIELRKPWITNIKYVGSFSYMQKESYHSEAYTSANYPYSSTTTDGTILANKPGLEVWDSNGNKITNFDPNNADLFARYLPASYIGRNDIESKEIGAFANVTANLHKKWGNTNHAFSIGVDIKTDGNEGDGKMFDPSAPPYRNLSAHNSSFRPRSYKDVPYVNQLGAFAEEAFKYTFANRELAITAGVRYDKISVVKDAFSPRVNASFEVIPQVLKVRGGYGLLAKAPSVLYLHPEKAYFEYVNINELPNNPDNGLFITTTRVFDSENKNLKIAKNRKAEIGFDLKVGQARLAVTAFNERLKDGYMMGLTENSFMPLTYDEYKRIGSDIVLSESNPVLAKFYTPTNRLQSKSKGVEFDLNLGRFNAIRTAFSANGMWIRTQRYQSGYTFFDENSGVGGSNRTHVALYEEGMSKSNIQRFISSARVTHNIPEIGFVVTLTFQAIWNESQWYSFGNDSIPVKYISKNDGKVYDFDYSKRNDPEFITLLRQVETKKYIKEKYAPAYTFNINLTKEVGDFLRMSFFANNMFRSYPTVTSKREQTVRLSRQQDFFFGLELSLTL